MKIFILFISLFCILHLFDATCDIRLKEEIEIVDPYSLYHNRQQKQVILPEEYSSGDGYNQAIAIRNENAKCYSFCKEKISFEVFSRRLINIFLKNSRIKIYNGIATGSVNLEASLDELEIIKGFGEGIISIRQFDSILDRIFKAPEVPVYEEFFSYTDMLLFHLYEHRRTFVSILFSIVLIPIIVKNTRTKLGIFTLFFTVTTIISFMMTWQQLLQDAEIKLATQRSIYSKRPDECSYMDLGFFGSLKLFWGIGKGDCIKYYEALMKDPTLEVTPNQAFIHMCTKSASYPILLFGEEFSQLIENITNTLPWWIRPVVKPLILLITLFLIYGILFIHFGGKFGIKIGPLFHFYIRGRDTVQSQNTLNVNERQAIDEIRNVENINRTEILETSNLEENHIATNITKYKTASNSSQDKKSQVIGKSTQTEDEVQKTDENDSNSDECLDDDGYEKISKKIIEREISRSRIEILECDDLQKKEEPEINKEKNKKSLEISGKNS